MKKLYIIASAALTLGATSCDDTLDKQPLDEIVSNTQYWANDDNVQTQIDRFYNDYSGYGNGKTDGSGPCIRIPVNLSGNGCTVPEFLITIYHYLYSSIGVHRWYHWINDVWTVNIRYRINGIHDSDGNGRK